MALAAAMPAGTAVAQQTTQATAGPGSPLDRLNRLSDEAETAFAGARWVEAEKRYRAIVSLMETLPQKNPTTMLKANERIAITLWRRNRLDEAIVLLGKGISEAGASGQVARADIYVAAMTLAAVHYQAGRQPAAEAIVSRMVRPPLGSPPIPTSISGQAHTLFARILTDRGDTTRAKQVLLDRIQALRPLTTMAARIERVQLLIGAAELAITQNRLGEAEAAFRDALRLGDGVTAIAALRPRIAIGLANVLITLGRFDAARDLTRAIGSGLYRSPVTTRESLNLRLTEAAIDLSEQRDTAALAGLRIVVAEWPKIGRPDDPVVLAARNYVGMLAIKRERWGEAEQAFAAIVAATRNKPGPGEQAFLNAAAKLGLVMARSGRADEGEQIILAAGARQLPSINRDDSAIYFSALALAQTRLLQGPSKDAMAPVQKALELWRARSQVATRYRLANTVFSAEVPDYRDDESREVFETYAEAAWRASATSPQRRAAISNEVFIGLQEAETGSIDQALVQAGLRASAEEREQGLGELIRKRQALGDDFAVKDAELALARVAKATPQPLLQQYESERNAIMRDTRDLDSRIAQAFPEYTSFARPRQLSVAEVQRLLGRDEALLFVVPTRFGTQAMAITRDGVDWHRSDMTAKDVGLAVSRLLWDCDLAVTVPAELARQWTAETGGAYSYDRKTAYRLYRELVAPLNQRLNGKRRLFVVAVGPLSSLPFGILVTRSPEGADSDPSALRGSGWLADAHEIAVLPTVQTLQLLKRPAAQPASLDGTIRFAGYGDPLLGGGQQTRGASRARSGSARVRSIARDRSGSLAALRKLSRLPGTLAELEGMRQAFAVSPAALRLGAANTETSLKRADLSQVQVLAFATHGLMGSELYPNSEPGLVFTPPKTATTRDDGYLTASEIMGLKLAADWVILSACNTAAGDGSAGATGLSGLARAFFYAGAKDLLVSHWAVHDDVAARITVEAINLKRATPSMSRAGALQRAMRSVRDDAENDPPDSTWAHPGAWGPFSLVGIGD